MPTFQKALLVGLILLLIIITIILIFVFHKKNNNISWPPAIPGCPDYWEVDNGSGNDPNKIKCINIKNIGTCSSKNPSTEPYIADFSLPQYQGSNSICAKYNWASNCGVAWEGINYGVPIPSCNTST